LKPNESTKMVGSTASPPLPSSSSPDDGGSVQLPV